MEQDTDILRVVGIDSKGYGTFPKLVAKDRRLTIEAKAIYAYFCSYKGVGNSAFPKVTTILHDLCISQQRYLSHFKLLVKYGYIKVEKLRLPNGRWDKNVYELIILVPEPSEEENRPHPQNNGVDVDNCPHPQNLGVDGSHEDNLTTNNNSINNYLTITENVKILWKSVVDNLSQELTPKSLETWILPIQPSVQGTSLTLSCPNEFLLDWIKSRYKDMILNSIPDNSGLSEVVLKIENSNNEAETYKLI